MISSRTGRRTLCSGKEVVVRKARLLHELSCAFFPMLRMAGHRGIAITHVCSDRAAWSSMDRKFKRMQHACYDTTDWCIGNGWAAHDCQNAVELCMSPLAIADLLGGLHVVIESLSNSFSLIHGHVRDFVIRYVHYDDSDEDNDAVVVFWSVERRRPHCR